MLESPSQPLFQALIIATIGLLCLTWRRYRLASGVLVLAALWLWLCSTAAFAGWLQDSLANRYPARPAASYSRADAIVILGGGGLPRANPDNDDDKSDVQATRVGFGLQLFRHSLASRILLSGGNREAVQMAEKLEQMGIPENALQIEAISRNTHQNALYSAALLKQEGRQRILLVTSPMHMPRAMASFKRQGLAVTAAPALDPGQASRINHREWWPTRTALHLTSRCLREYFGLFGYKLLGWA